MRLLVVTALLLVPSMAAAEEGLPAAWPPVPLAWEGEGSVPALLSLEAVFTPPDQVEIVQVVVTADHPGTLTVALPDRSGAGGAEEVYLEANGLPLQTERREAGQAFRFQALSADLIHTAWIEFEPEEMVVLKSRVRLRDTWFPYLEPQEAPAWHSGPGPLFVPYHVVEIDLRPAGLWAGTGGEIRAVVKADPAPMPHLPLLQPGGWRRESFRAVWEGKGRESLERLVMGVPALETETLVLGEPAQVAAWLASESGATPEALELLAAAVEARTGRTFEGEAELAAFFGARAWYQPAPDWGPDIQSSRARVSAEALRAAARGGAPAPDLAEAAGTTPEPEPAEDEPAEPEPAAAPEPKAAPVPKAAPEPKAAPAGATLDVPRSVEEAQAWVSRAHAEGVTVREVKILRNAYFAQYGQTFRTPWLQAHYEAQDWYEPRPGSVNLTPVEREIVSVLATFERELSAATTVPDQPRSSTQPGSRLADLPDGFLDDPEEVPRSRQQAEAWVERARAWGFGPTTAKVMRNAIFALHGRMFRTGWLQEFYDSKPWYRPDPDFSPDRLSAPESQAVSVLLAFERELQAAAPGE